MKSLLFSVLLILVQTQAFASISCSESGGTRLTFDDSADIQKVTISAPELGDPQSFPGNLGVPTELGREYTLSFGIPKTVPNAPAEPFATCQYATGAPLFDCGDGALSGPIIFKDEVTGVTHVIDDIQAYLFLTRITQEMTGMTSAYYELELVLYGNQHPFNTGGLRDKLQFFAGRDFGPASGGCKFVH